MIKIATWFNNYQAPICSTIDDLSDVYVKPEGLENKKIINKTDWVRNAESKVVADLTKIRHRIWSPKFDHGSLIEEYCRPLIKEIFNEEG